MKRAISILLSLAMMFALCGSASADLSAEEKNSLTSASQTNCFLIEDVKVISSHYAGSGMVFFPGENAMEAGDVLDYKITNLFQQSKGKPYPAMFILCFSFLDEEGVIIQTARQVIDNLSYGDKIYASSILTAHLPDKTIPENACAVKFTGVQAGSPTEVMDTYSFAEPYFFEIPGREGTLAPAASVSNIVEENDYFKLDAICVDDSYRAERSDVLRQVYLFFTVTANNKNLDMDSKDIYLTINGENEYQSYRIFQGRNFFPNYSHSASSEKVYIGESLKVFTTFEIPKGDLVSGRTITLRDSSIPEINSITLSTDLIQHFNGQEEIAKGVDPEGYEKSIHMHEEADAETQRTVNNYIVGRTYWATLLNNSTCSVAFNSGNKCELTMVSITTDATYSIRNGFIYIHTVHAPEKPFEIPYTLKDNGEVEMDVSAMIGK